MCSPVAHQPASWEGPFLCFRPSAGLWNGGLLWRRSAAACVAGETTRWTAMGADLEKAHAPPSRRGFSGGAVYCEDHSFRGALVPGRAVHAQTVCRRRMCCLRSATTMSTSVAATPPTQAIPQVCGPHAGTTTGARMALALKGEIKHADLAMCAVLFKNALMGASGWTSETTSNT